MQAIVIAVSIVCILVIAWGLNRVNHVVFIKIRKKYNGLQFRFLERFTTVVIIVMAVIFCFAVFGGMDKVWSTLLGGTAIFTGVVAFVAQDVIKDILAGLMISIYKPFEIGNRIELENGICGIIKDITMRHVVMLTIDTQMIIIPNSRLNSMVLKNYSYHSALRSAIFNFRVAYGTDLEKAMNIIRIAVIESELSVPQERPDGSKGYPSVYFMAYEDSSLQLTTTVYYKAGTPSEKLISDINLRVDQALRSNGIEIPYNYLNVMFPDKAGEHKAFINKQ
ncbi:MAG: mechanosensitive ion channel [Ruminococcus sp.]|nr:mechanosensitive ion channel [Ruminococcus sp.]